MTLEKENRHIVGNLMEEVKNFFRKLIHSDRFQPPRQVREGFYAMFKDAVNIEWNDSLPSFYEAIFHQGGIEKIARFTPEGHLIEVSTNLTFTEIPAPVSQVAAVHGELMNAIQIRTHIDCSYEIIVRKADHSRHLMLINENCEVMKEKQL